MKSNQDNQIQNTTLYNMYLSKKIYPVYNAVCGKAPEARDLSRIFVKSNLTVCKVTFNCKLQKNLWEQDVLAPQ